MIVLSKKLAGKLEEHAKREAQKEACGIIAGKRKGEQKFVRKIYECKNVSRRPETAYEISPDELLEIITEVEKKGLDVLGFYHSHPMPLEHPSYIDAQRATWSGHSYIIISEKMKISSWVWDEEKKRFIEEEVRFISSPSSRASAVYKRLS